MVRSSQKLIRTCKRIKKGKNRQNILSPGSKGSKRSKAISLRVDRPSILPGEHYIFESLILKLIFFSKTFIAHFLHID